MTPKCKYCGEEANYQMTNGSYCCESHFSKCPAIREKKSNTSKVSQNKKTVKERKSKAMKKLHAYNSQYRKNFKKGNEKAIEKRRTPENREKLSKILKELHKTPEFRLKFVKGIIEVASNKKMNREEKKLFSILQTIYPNLFIFNFENAMVLNIPDGTPTRYIPDFYNEDLKIAIDSFGLYWHQKAMKDKGVTEEEYLKRRYDHYSDLGWNYIAIWTSVEMKDPMTLIKKIKDFVEESLGD